MQAAPLLSPSADGWSIKCKTSWCNIALCLKIEAKAWPAVIDSAARMTHAPAWSGAGTGKSPKGCCCGRPKKALS